MKNRLWAVFLFLTFADVSKALKNTEKIFLNKSFKNNKIVGKLFQV